jgi:uncharacterized membrane protein
MADVPTDAPRLRDQDGSWLARKGMLAIALVMLAGSLLVAFLAINDVIAVWLEDKWVPVWRAAFAVSVAGVALVVITRLTGKRPW